MERTYAVVDFETGGFKPEENAITEIGLVVYDKNFNEIDSYQSYITPYDDNLTYSQEALDITDLSMEKIIDEGKTIKEVASDLELLLKKYKRPLFVAHNAQFDYQWLPHFKQYGKKELKNKFDQNTMCTLVLSRLAFPNKNKHTLGAMCEEFEIELDNAHSALFDVRATGELLAKLVTKMRGTVVTDEVTIEQVKKDFKL